MPKMSAGLAGGGGTRAHRRTRGRDHRSNVTGMRAPPRSDTACRDRAMAPGSHQSLSCRQQHSHARRLCRRGRGVAGPVSMGPFDWNCPRLFIHTNAFKHGGTPGVDPSGNIDAHRVRSFLRRDAAQTVGESVIARRQQRQSRPAAVHPAALSRRSSPSTFRTATKRPRGFRP